MKKLKIINFVTITISLFVLCLVAVSRVISGDAGMLAFRVEILYFVATILLIAVGRSKILTIRGEGTLLQIAKEIGMASDPEDGTKKALRLFHGLARITASGFFWLMIYSAIYQEELITPFRLAWLLCPMFVGFIYPIFTNKLYRRILVCVVAFPLWGMIINVLTHSDQNASYVWPLIGCGLGMVLLVVAILIHRKDNERDKKIAMMWETGEDFDGNT